MIDISDSAAKEIQLLLDYLRRPDPPDNNRTANMRRRAKLIINYLNKK